MTHSRPVLRHRDGGSGGEWRETPGISRTFSQLKDSNLRMAESKSNCFAFGIKVRSEKSLIFDSISINYLAGISEFMGSARGQGCVS